ncbi:MAG: carbon-nitrogen hydrolase family protein [Planctomycetota bacterium]
MDPYLAATIQLTSTPDVEGCWKQVRERVRRAAWLGARLVATPENTLFLGAPEEKARLAETLDGETCERFAGLARELSIHLLLGSFGEKSDEPVRCYNTSVLFGPEGERLGSYRKIHLFDVDLSPEVCYQESAHVKAGRSPVVIPTELGKIGLSVCYDLRFPEPYREEASCGAELLMVPAAFTMVTGRDHWEPLLRARAIENQCYLIAPAQFGRHGDVGLRESYGHAMIIDPWGQVVASVADGQSLALAEIDLGRITQIRAALPVGKHRRL